VNTALIVGAGIGGLAAGVALQRRGWRVRIFERAAHPRELGFALNLAANAIAALRELGVADEIVRRGYAPRLAEFRTEGGRLLRRIDAHAMVADSAVAMRAVVHGALLSAVGSDAVQLSREAVGFETNSHAVTLQFRDDARTESGEILVAADGIASSILRRRPHHVRRQRRPRAAERCSGTSLCGQHVDDGPLLLRRRRRAVGRAAARLAARLQ
jgi:2-polyprenyl-6-methoxyphenol hydroxylase-like FAD-dependent oxidoreductase